MPKRRKPIPPDSNVFVRRYYERQVEEMLARENLPVIDLDRLPKLHSSKPSPASTPSAGRVKSMEVRARQRKTQAFVDKKRLQKLNNQKEADHGQQEE